MHIRGPDVLVWDAKFSHTLVLCGVPLETIVNPVISFKDSAGQSSMFLVHVGTYIRQTNLQSDVIRVDQSLIVLLKVFDQLSSTCSS